MDNGLRLALSFLTTLPVLSATYEYDARHWRTAIFSFPAIGVVVGGLAWLVGWGAQHLFAGWLAAALAVTMWTAVTGGLHLDGLADCADGLLATATPQRRLEIMRDPRVGAFGAIGLILFLLLKVGAVQNLLMAGSGATHSALAFLAAAAFGRMLILWAARQPSARPGGMGAVLAEQIRPFPLSLITLITAVGMVLLGWRGVVGMITAVSITIGIIWLARRRIGGVTGDVYGLLVELVELTVLLSFAASF